MSTVETTSPSTKGRGAVRTPGASDVDVRTSTKRGRAPAVRGDGAPPGVRVRPRPRHRLGSSAAQAVAVVLIVLVPAAGAAFISAQMSPTYGAVTEILYEGVDAGSPETVERDLATQRVLLVSRPAIATASRAVNRDPVEVAKNVETEILEGSNVVRLQVTDESARVARALVKSLAAQYTAAVDQTAAAVIAERRQVITGQVEQINARLDEIRNRIVAVSNGPLIPAGVGNVQLPIGVQAEVRTLETEAQVLRQQVAALQEQAVQLDTDPATATAVATAEVVVAPTLLPEPVGPQPLRAAAAGGLVGLLLAFVMVTVLRHRRAADDHEAAVARP
jgi:prefoldin subunit 5